MAKIDLLIIKAQKAATAKKGILVLGTVVLQEGKLELKCHIKRSGCGNAVRIRVSRHDTMEEVEQELSKVANKYPNPEHDVTVVIDDTPGDNS